MRPRISIRGFVRPSVRPLVRGSVRNAFFFIGQKRLTMLRIKQKLHQNNFQTLPHSIYPFLSLSFSLSVCLSIGPSIGPSVTHFLDPEKMDEKGLKWLSNSPQALSFNLSLLICLSISLTIFLSQSFFQNLLSKSFFQNLSDSISSTIFLL